MANPSPEVSLHYLYSTTHYRQKTIVAYSDNSSVIEGSKFNRFYPNKSGLFQENLKLTHYLMKVETHNHPTAILARALLALLWVFCLYLLCITGFLVR